MEAQSTTSAPPSRSVISEVRGLGGDVQAGGDAHALQRLVLDELLADDLQDLHRLVRPLDALLAQIGKFEFLTSQVTCVRLW